ncbi:MAG: DoxX family protein [Myxococcota bacterium]
MKNALLWVPRLAAAAILLTVGYAKLTASPPEVALFLELGMEPQGRIIIGVVEFTAGALLLSPQAATGALLAVAVMCGAIIAHVTVIGIDLRHSWLLLTVLTSALIVMYVRRADLPLVGRTFGRGTRSVP